MLQIPGASMGCGMGRIFAQVALGDIAVDTLNLFSIKCPGRAIELKRGLSPHVLVCRDAYAYMHSKDGSANTADWAHGARC